MFDFLKKKKKKGPTFDPRVEVTQLGAMSPPSALVYQPLRGDDDEFEDLGKAFFLRRDKKIYSEGPNIYITAPDGMTSSSDNNSLNNKVVKLQFFNRRIPHTIDCRVLGRFRLLPEVVETLDFNAKSAYKLLPVTKISKKEKRQNYRYITDNFGDSRIPVTTHITFDAFIKRTNHDLPTEGAPSIILDDLAATPYRELSNHRPFTTREGIDEFKELMLKKQPHDRFVNLTKVLRDESSSMVKKPDEELLLGQINILGLEMESMREVLYLRKSEKAGIKKGEENPYNLHPGERILSRFFERDMQYEMLFEVVEARTQNEVMRPVEYMREETGLKINLVDYSTGGVLIESSPEFLRLVLGDDCPPNVEDEADFEGDYWEKAFETIRVPLLHLALYPKMHFPDNQKKFEPELAAKFSIVGTIVRTHVARTAERNILLHGIQFAYDPQGVPLEEDELVNWRYTRMMKDNVYLKACHTHLSQLIGHLENRARDNQQSMRARRPSEEPAAAR
ncbi:MAG: hypothetical protein VX733_01120 [Candidatus Latescibacterota bacterium]|nr:hypothetical protein [Candidatus Latescibacterota bacterium]